MFKAKMRPMAKKGKMDAEDMAEKMPKKKVKLTKKVKGLK